MTWRLWRSRSLARRRARASSALSWQQRLPSSTRFRSFQMPSSGCNSGAYPGRQLLQVQPPGGALVQEVLAGLAPVNRRAVPDDQELATDCAQQQAQEAHASGGVVGLVPGPGSAGRGARSPAGPPLAAEPVRLRPPLHQGGQLGEWLGGVPGLAPGGGMAPQRLHPLLPAPLEPRADGTRGHPECGSDVLVLPALLLQLPSASPPSLAPVELRALRLHGASIPSFYASTQRSVVAVAHDFVGKQQIHCLRSSPRQTA